MSPARAPARTAVARGGTMDPVRAVFWAAYNRFFPPHAAAHQTDSGALVISWSMSDDRHARHEFAAPVVLRFEPELISAMASANPEQRKRIAATHEVALRAGLVGYDPYAGVQSRVIVLG